MKTQASLKQSEKEEKMVDDDGDDADVMIQADHFFKQSDDHDDDDGLSDYGADEEDQELEPAGMELEIECSAPHVVTSSSSSSSSFDRKAGTMPDPHISSSSSTTRRHSLPAGPSAIRSPTYVLISPVSMRIDGRDRMVQDSPAPSLAGSGSPSKSGSIRVNGVTEAKSYTKEETSVMLSRASRELRRATAYAKGSWSMSQQQLKQRIMGLRFYADAGLNSMMQKVLMRDDCLSSQTQSLKLVIRIYWSEEEILTRSSRLAQSGRRVNGLAREVVRKEAQLPHLKDVHQLFMKLHDVGPQEWLNSGQQYKVYQTIYAIKQQIAQRRQARKIMMQKQQQQQQQVQALAAGGDSVAAAGGGATDGAAGGDSRNKRTRFSL